MSKLKTGKTARPMAVTRARVDCEAQPKISYGFCYVQSSITHHEFDRVPRQEEPESPSRSERSDTVDHHRVDLTSVRRLRQAPLKHLVDDSDLVASTGEEGLALAVLDPRIGREASDFGEGGAAEEEARAGITGGAGRALVRATGRREEETEHTRQYRRRP
jgi:hypothetical protein